MTMASWFHSCDRADEKEHTNAHTHTDKNTHSVCFTMLRIENSPKYALNIEYRQND